MIADAQITFLPSSDLGRSRVFYEGILGLQLVVDQGTCHIYLVTTGAFLGLCVKEAVQRADGVIVTLVADDVDGWCERIIALGGKIESGPEHNARYGIYQAFIRDPDDNLLEIQRFDDRAWASPSA
ncbi:MAG: VOC family protein [Actinomycetota bacterium]|nr:VOC family protein [Actinomycetota bacterium]